MTWLKAIHIAGLLVWTAGLVYLPVMLLLHRRVSDAQDFVRTQRIVRFAFTAVISPAAVVAIGAGAALLLVAPGALSGWMFLKLAAIGILVLVHLYAGHALAALASVEARASPVRLLGSSLAASGAIAAVLYLVLAKPEIDTGFLPDWLHAPGRIQWAGPAPTPN